MPARSPFAKVVEALEQRTAAMGFHKQGGTSGQIFKPRVLVYLALGLAVFLGGTGYRFSQYTRSTNLATKVAINKLWDDHRKPSLTLASGLIVKAHGIPTTNAIAAAVQSCTSFEYATPSTAASAPRSVAVFRSSLSFRGPPSLHISLA
jgi:hypothetical protein